MKVGIIGLPYSGKTTIFNVLTGAHEKVGAYTSDKERLHLGTIKVPDKRLDKLAEIFQPKKITHAEIIFEDLAGADTFSKEKGIKPQILAEMRTMESLVHVVRAFKDPNVLHPLTTIDPARDVKELDSEMEVSDAVIADERIKRLEKENQKGIELDTLIKCKSFLDKDLPLRQLEFTNDEQIAISSYSFISQKPLLILANAGESKDTTADLTDLQRYVSQRKLTLIELCGKLEMEIEELELEEQKEFIKELGIGEPGRDKFVRASYDMMGLISFFTTVGKEVKAWTIHKGMTAPEAAGKVHSDIERGFIRAETINYEDFIALGTMAKAKEEGKLRLEGKEYVVKDGDIINFRFNV